MESSKIFRDEYSLNPKKCLCCDEELTFEQRRNKFCSSSCAATYNNIGRIRSTSSKEKTSAGVKKFWDTVSLDYRIEYKNKLTNNNRSPERIEKTKTFWNNKILNSDFNELSIERKKKYLLLENNCCRRCGLNEWQGEKLILELEHVDGNTNNNLKENLTLLCPNCHSLTHTWRGRNKSLNKVSDELLLESLKTNDSIYQALLNVKLAPKGGNYKRCHKLIEENNLKHK